MPHLQFEETVEKQHYTTSEPPNSFDIEENDECREQPSLDWQRRWQIHKLHKYNRQTTTKKDYPQWYIDNPTNYDTRNDPYQEAPPPKPTSMTLVIAERVTEIIVDDSTSRPKSILKNQGSHTTAPQSPTKNGPVNPIRAGILRSPTLDVAPDCHQHENITCRTTTEAVDLAQSATNTETTPSKTKSRRIKRSLLLEPLSNDETLISSPPLTSQSEDEVEDTQPIRADETNMQPASQSGVATNTPQQDKPRSYPPEQTAEYQRKNQATKEMPTPHPKR